MKKISEEKVYIKDIALIVYYFIFGGIFFITAYYNLDTFMAIILLLGIFNLSIFVKYNLDFSIKNIKRIWKKDKRQFKIGKLSDKELKRRYLDKLYGDILSLLTINLTIFIIISYFVDYYKFDYLWILYFSYLIYSIYYYKRIKKRIYLNEHKRKDT